MGTVGPRLGAGVVLEAYVLRALRTAGAPEHARIAACVLALAEAGTPLIITQLSLAESARQIQDDFGSAEAAAMLREARDAFNILPVADGDLAAAADLLAQGVEHMTLEQAAAGLTARRYACSICGSSPAYHILQIPVVLY